MQAVVMRPVNVDHRHPGRLSRTIIMMLKNNHLRKARRAHEAAKTLKATAVSLATGDADGLSGEQAKKPAKPLESTLHWLDTDLAPEFELSTLGAARGIAPAGKTKKSKPPRRKAKRMRGKKRPAMPDTVGGNSSETIVGVRESDMIEAGEANCPPSAAHPDDAVDADPATDAARSRKSKAKRRKRDPRLKPLLTLIARREWTDVQFDNGRRLRVASGASADGNRKVFVTDSRRLATVDLADCAGSGRAALAEVTRQGIIIIGSTAPLLEAIGQLRRFPRLPLVERPGWTGNVFGMPNGRVITPPHIPHAIALYEPVRGVCDRSGTVKGWRDEFALPLSDQPEAVFILMAMFVAPMLRFVGYPFNPGFELSGAEPAGKARLLKLMASVAGPAIEGATGRYWVTCIDAETNLETAIGRHRDVPMVLDGAALLGIGGSIARRATAMSDFYSRLAGGGVATGERPRTGARFAYVMSSNESAMDIAKDRNEGLLRTLCERLLTIPLNSEYEHGVFKTLPAGCGNRLAFIAMLTDAARRHHGVALPAFLKCLVDDAARVPRSFQRWIERRMMAFRSTVACNEHDADAVLNADAFGMVYVAGLLAQRYRVLPATLECRAVAVRCYLAHRSLGRATTPPLLRLKAVMDHPDVIDLDTFDGQLTDAMIRRAPGFFKTHRSGEREFLMTTLQRNRVFPDWFNLRYNSEFSSAMRRDTDRWDRQRQLTADRKPDRFFCFVLPDNSFEHQEDE
jgi:hypothetical protein